MAAGVAGGLYLWNAAASSTKRAKVLERFQVRSPAPVRNATGALRVTSKPAGAQVVVDGKARGVTPLTISDVDVGRHAVELKGDAGTIRRTVTVAADTTAEIDELIFPGWLAVYSPFDLVISEGGRVLRLDDRNELMLPPGRHELRLVNRALAYEAVRQVELKPGETTTLRLTPPLSTMTVTATEAAEVWLDRARVGETPLNALPVPIGVHEIVVKGSAGEERQLTTTITVNPFILNIDFSKPP